MSKIPEQYYFNSVKYDNVEDLIYELQDMYSQLAEAINRKPDVNFRNVPGQSDDIALSNGDINVDRLTNKVEILISHDDPPAVTWKEI